MLCPKCHKTIPDGSRFCLECGSAVSSDSQSEAAQAAVRAGVSLGGALTQTGPAPADGAAAPALSLGDQRTLQGAGSPAGISPSAGAGVALTKRYELEAEIGRGGFAVVWRARDRKLGRTVAVKRLLPEASQGPGGAQTVQRFEREAQAIATLNHRNIVQVFDSDTDADGRYIVMEYVSGGTLRDYLKKRGKLPVAEAVALAMGLCRGLAAAHRQGLVHRDVKPANVLLEPAEAGGPLPRLVDFGLARQGRESELSATGYGLGTPYYMAPEQRRDAKSVTHTADIYALGKTLYEMLTGEIPDSVDPALLPPPEELGRIILKCIRSNPAERYFSAEDLLRDLEALGTGAAGSAPGAAAAGSTACPACGRRNPPDAKFCEACGTGLMRRCPECDRENGLGLRFCGGCGSDVPGFLQTRDALARMQGFAKELKWSRVTKEHGLLARNVKLPGEKGKKLSADLRGAARSAVAAEQVLADKRAFLAKALEAREFEQALALCREIVALDPADEQAAVTAAELELTTARADLVARGVTLRRLAGAKRFTAARAVACEMLQQAEVLARWSEPDRLLGLEGVTGTGVRSEAESVLVAADQAEAAALAVVQTGHEALTEQDYRTAMAKADEAQTLCADLPAALELRQQVEAGLDTLRQLVGEARAHVGAVRELTQAGRLAEARRALASLVAQYGEVEVPEDAEVAPDWIVVINDLAAVEKALAERERQARRRQATAHRRLLWLAGAAAALMVAGLLVWLGVSTSRKRQYAAFVASGERAVAAGDWTRAEQEVGKALALDPKGSEALALAAQLDPTLTVTAELDGREVPGAQITINAEVQQQTTPASYKLARGSIYAFSVTLLPKDGRFFTTAETKVTADRPGPQSWKGRIQELKLVVPAGFRAASGTVPEPYTNTGWAKEIVHEATGITLVYIPAGSFTMGSPADEPGCDKDETPHGVTLSKGFWLGKYEVTQAEYEAVVGANPSDFKGARNPVEQVSWNDAMAFCAKLTERERAAGPWSAGYEYRLPTEAEWEYAARGGPVSKGYTYAGSNNVDEVAWYCDNSGKTTHPVGGKKPNELGLFDMSGNVCEWCMDWYGAYPSGTLTDPVGPAQGSSRVRRGGGWDAGAAYCRAATRLRAAPSRASDFLGFRVAFAAPVQ
jgi:formylglycine-generating enzyme required for sulfatase activity